MSSGLFQSTPSARRATCKQYHLNPFTKISIHALREESDFKSMQINAGLVLFQSTPSARRATQTGKRAHRKPEISIHALREESDLTYNVQAGAVDDFNPRPPRGERREMIRPGEENEKISIHALREESDAGYNGSQVKMFLFQSTPSARRATSSLHEKICRCRLANFNPRPPRGERPLVFAVCVHFFFISIHALREESDQKGANHRPQSPNFNPRPPRGERPAAERF